MASQQTVRKDDRGRRLRDGEGQRKNGSYYYRYNDVDGSRRTVYAKTLNDLRAKEEEIQRMSLNNVSYFGGEITLGEMIDRMMELKSSWRETTRYAIQTDVNRLKKHRLYNVPINKIKAIDCKELLIGMREDGYSIGPIRHTYTLMKDSFDLAVESDYILKNPCGFKLNTIVSGDEVHIHALTEEQVASLLKFMKADACGKKMLDTFIILLGTGLRISEFAALTVNDVDFSTNTISVGKQIVAIGGDTKVSKTKTISGVRVIPMTEDVRDAMSRIVKATANRKMEKMIDGYIGFLSITRNGVPVKGPVYCRRFDTIIRRYNKVCSPKIERCTPHVLRHTFATMLNDRGANIKTLQYLLGHADVQTTLNTYVDCVEETVFSEIKLLENKRA